MTTTVQGIDGLKELVGQHLDYSDYVEVTQEQVNLFADATGDHQWIHVDPERAKSGPFGGPIAHGYLTLSLAPALLPQILTVGGISMGVRSEEHTSELQSRQYLVCRLLLEKKNHKHSRSRLA